MSSLLLAKLKNKPVPQKKEQVEIIIPEPAKKEEVEIKTVIVDKRGEIDINREEILERIRQNRDFKGVVSKPEVSLLQRPQPEPAQPEPVLEVIEEEQEAPSKAPSKEEIIIEQPEVKKERKQTKKNKKLKLVLQPDVETEAEAQAKEIAEIVEEKKELTPQEKEIFTIKIKKRRTKKPKEQVQEGPFENVIIGTVPLLNRLPPQQPKVLIRASKIGRASCRERVFGYV